MSQPSARHPIVAPPPRVVAVAGALMALQAVGVVILAVAILVAGLSNSAAVGQLLAQTAYYLVLAVAMGVCGWGLLSGRRWARTPTIVVQIVIVAVAYWMAVPSGRLGLGLGLGVVAIVTGGLLLTRPANEWISRFPSLFGPEPDR